jgi:hypothetical protein
MLCKSCRSLQQRKFSAEINIHFPGLKGLTRPTVWVFPEIVVCLACGFVEFSIPEAELRVLEESDCAAA